MKKTITLLFGLLFSLNLFGQFVNYETDSRWFLGFNVGGTWNTTDVDNKTYAGWGFVFGKSFNYNYGRVLSYDLRARYLGGKWYGQDYDTTGLGPAYNGALNAYRDSLGFGVNNFEAQVHELGLEFAIHLNRLRERTGIDPYIFGGANIVWNQTYGDLLNQDTIMGSTGIYNYDPSNISKTSVSTTLDGIYDSPLDGSNADHYNVSFMPSLGFGIGYHLGPHFSIGLEHKTTFALRDDFDGFVDATPQGKGKWTNDIYHYTSGYLRFHFRRGKPSSGGGGGNTGGPGNNLAGGGGCQDPVIAFMQPGGANVDVTTQDLSFKAKVSNVVSREHITVRVNGNVTTNFLYNDQTDILESYLVLAPGMNTVQITAANGCGSVSQNYTINYVNCVEPAIHFTSPSHANYQVNQTQFDIRAQVDRANSVKFRVNGISTTSFYYNNATGSFQGSVALQKGANTFEIIAANDCGTVTETATVNLADCTDPSIVFLNSNTNHVEATTQQFNFKAQVLHVAGRGNIGFRLNGVNTQFTFDPDSKYLGAGLSLQEGTNTIQITATNDCGTETETFTIDYSPCVEPYVQMIDPAGQGIQTTSANYIVKAKVFNVVSVNQIQLMVNGVVQGGGGFNNVTKVFQKQVALQMGQNTIKIVATTDCGSDIEVVEITRVREVSNEKITICHRPPGNPGNAQTLEIPMSAWPAHQAHGDVLGPCPEVEEPSNDKITICHHPPGNPGNTQTLEIPMSAWPAHQAHGDVLGPCPEVEEDHGNEKITICHHPPGNSGKAITLEIPMSAWPAHQAHGDVLGECPEEEQGNNGNEKITICHHPPGNSGKAITLEIPMSAWPAHQAHGDVLGPCPEEEQGNNGQGNQGNNGNEKITICHHPPGNSGKAITLEIPMSAWPAHQAHGDVLGECPEEEQGNNGNEKITICHHPPGNSGKAITLEIPMSAWPAHQAHGDVLGPCPEEEQGNGNNDQGNNGNNENEKITICHHPPGNSGKAITLEIPLSAWPAHQAHGDVLGECPEEEDNGNNGQGNSGGNGNSGSSNGSQGSNANSGNSGSGSGNSGNTGANSGTQENNGNSGNSGSSNGSQGSNGNSGNSGANSGTQGNNGNSGNSGSSNGNQGSNGNSGNSGANSGTQGNNGNSGNSGSSNGNQGSNANSGNGNQNASGGSNTEGSNEQIQNENGFGSGATIGSGTENTEEQNTEEENSGTGTEGEQNGNGNGKGKGGKGAGGTSAENFTTGQETITICHNVQGKNGGTETMVISVSDWPKHKAHGDKMGACANEVKEAGEPPKVENEDQEGQSSEGEKKITICHHPPGNPEASQTIEISISSWPAHQAHGCTLGPCEDNEGDTGVNNETISNEDNLGGTVTVGGSTGTEGSTGTSTETISNENGFGSGGTIGGSTSGGSTGTNTGGSTGTEGSTGTNTETISNEDGFGSGGTIGGGSNMTTSNPINENTSGQLKSAEEEAAKKAAEEAAKKKAAEEAAKKAAEEAAKKKAAEEAAKKAAAEAAKKKAAEEAAKKAAAEAAKKKAAEEAAKKAAAEAAKKKAAEEAAKKAAEEAAKKKAAEEAAKKAAEEAAKKKAAEEAAKKKAEEEKSKPTVKPQIRGGK